MKRNARIDTKKAFRLLWRYLAGQKWKIFWGIIATVSIGLMELFTGALLKFLTNTVTKIQGIAGSDSELKVPVKLNLDIKLFDLNNEVVNTTLKGSEAILKGIIIISVIFFILYLLQGLFQYMREVFMNLAIERVLQKFKSDIFKSVLGAPISFFNKNSTGDIISRVNYDVTVLTDTINILVEISRFVIYMLMFIPAMFLINVNFALYTILFFPVSFIIIRIVASVIKRSSLKVSDNVGDYNSFLEERINRLKFIKVNRTEGREKDNFDDLVEKNYQFRKKLIFQRFFLKPSNEVLGMLVLAVLFIFFSKHLLNGNGNVGDIAFFLYLVKTSFKPVKKVAQAVGDLNMALISTGKIEEIFETEQETSDSKIKIGKEGIKSIIMRDVTLAYGNIDVLKGIDLKLSTGDRVLIKGETGAGKTSLCSIFPLLNYPKSGSIVVNSLNLIDISPANIRSGISYVSGETPLIAGTVTENLLYGTDADTSDLKNFSNILPDWVYTDPDRFIGGEETSITSGEARVIALVRALLCKSDMIILDEAFTYMDDKDISLFMGLIPEEKICLIVSKNRIVESYASQIFTLADGILN